MKLSKTKTALLGATIFTLVFLLEGFFFSGFIEISNVNSFSSFETLTLAFGSAVILLVLNAVTLVFLVQLVKRLPDSFKVFNPISVLVLILPLFLATIIWLKFSKFYIESFGGIITSSNYLAIPLSILNMVVFYFTVYYTSKLVPKKGD